MKNIKKMKRLNENNTSSLPGTTYLASIFFSFGSKLSNFLSIHITDKAQ